MKLFSNWQHRKILFLISLPQTAEFQSCAEDVKKCLVRLNTLKVDVYEAISRELLSRACKYDIVIVVAHKDEESENLILSDSHLSIDDFVAYLPTSFEGILDFSSCYSAAAMKRIKERCPKCFVQVSVRQTTLPLRLIMYPHIVELLNKDKKRGYRETYLEVLQAAAESVTDSGSCAGHSVKLGKQVSSIYAPNTVKRGTPFMIQVFFHNDADGKAVDIEAKRVDTKTGLKETFSIPLRLKKKDRLFVRLSFISPEKNYIVIEDNIDTKSIVWLGQKAKVVFCSTVMESFTGDSFVGRLMMEVNSIPIGESYFTICVADKAIVTPADIVLKPHDFYAEKSMAREILLKKLYANKVKLQEGLLCTTSDVEKKKVENSIQVCESCILLLQEETNFVNNPIKKVFVSSTSDMKPYREIVKNEIESCNMYPEMYENWPQSSQTPKHECCRRVIESDILFCILGSRYGYVEPTLGMSMTEIEYRTALEAGKTILVCIIDPLNKSDEPEELAIRQKELIDEIRSSRILKFFSDTDSLAKDATRNLSRL